MSFSNIFFKLYHRYPSLLPTLVLILVWYVLAETRLISPSLLASPQEVWGVILKAFSGDATLAEKFYIHAYHTIRRAFEGWILSAFLGTALGLLVGRTVFLYKASEPVVEYIRAIPPVLMFPLFLVALNYEEIAYILTIAFGCLPIMLLSVARGTLYISQDRLDILEVFNASRKIRSFVMTMEILPSFFLGMRITLSFAIIISVVTEMVFTPRSGLALGALARDSEIAFNTPMFYTCLLTIGTFGYISNMLMKKIEQKSNS